MNVAHESPPDSGDAPARGRPGARPEGGPEPSRITHAMEDYLKAIYALQARGDEATTQRLADELGISGPSVTNMAKRLHDLGLVEHEPYRGVRLTPAGRRVALEVVRHHRLLELYLAETLGFSWDEVHAEAERLEHHISDELAARIDRALGYPTHDPHGDPIPSADGAIAAVSPALLRDVAAGETVAVTRVSDRDPDKLRFLGEMGVRPGAEIEVVERFPFDGPLRIRVGAEEHLIGPGVAAMVNVAPPGEGEAPA